MTTLPRRSKWRDLMLACPKAGALQYWSDPPRCRTRKVLDDANRHQCDKEPAHADHHACPCGRKFTQLLLALGSAVLSGVMAKCGLNCSRERGDSERLARMLPPEAIDQELRQVLTQIGGLGTR
jgi:hypothetical protein